MPRTKVRKPKGAKLEPFIKNFNRLMQLKIRGLETEHEMMEQKFETTVETVMARYPPEIQNMTLGELLKSESPQKPFPQTPSRSQSRAPRSTARLVPKVRDSSDDGYQSKDSTKLKTAKKRSRSASTGRKSKLTEALQIIRKPKRELLKTPEFKPTRPFVITPKIKLNSAVNVLRKPKDGEMVFSTQGSPLLVSTTVNNRIANVNVPLKNGNVVSFLPFNEHSLSENIHLDEDTRQQLQILRSHLSKVLD